MPFDCVGGCSRKRLLMKERAFKYGTGDNEWCRACFAAELERHGREDFAGGGLYSRPPKYVLRQAEWAEFGY